MIKDHKGFIWISTGDGINRYDGYNFKIFKYDPADSSSLSDNFVYSVMEDRDGNIWACTRSNGLSKLNRKTGKFSRFNLYSANDSLIEKQRLSTTYVMHEDLFEEEIVLYVTSEGIRNIKSFKDGNKDYLIGVMSGHNFAVTDSTYIWHGTLNGLKKFNKKTQTDKSYFYNKTQIGADISIVDIHQDSDGILWLACWLDGLITFDTNTETFSRKKYNPDHPPGIGSNVVFDIEEDESGKLWILTSGDGYYQYDKKTEKYRCYKKPEIYTRLGLNYWGQGYVDDSGIHWLGTKNDGILKYAPKKDKFNTFNLSSEEDREVDIRAFYKDHKDSLWVSTVDALYKFDIQSAVFSKTKYDLNHTNILFQHSISAFHEEDNGNLWLGTEGGGLKRYHIKSDQVKGTYKFINTDLAGKVFDSNNYILSLTQDLNDNLWIETFGDLNHYIFDKKNFRFVNNPGHTLRSILHPLETEYLFVDHRDNYFYTTWLNGLYLLDSTYTIVENYRHKQNDQSSISNNHINTVYEDKSNNLWIGTAGGLNLLDRDTNKFTSFRVKNGLASDIIFSILEDDHGNLWMATPAGITRFSMNESGPPHITNYAVSDPITFYAEEISYKDDDGVMYFGGKNGFISFHPDHIQDNTRIPPIVVTDFKLFNESISPGMEGQSPLQYDISETDEIILSYDQNFFSFEFAALDYTDPGKNLYAYKMEGIDQDWVNSDASQRFANYTDVQPGEYVFMVKGSNNDGFWNDEPTSIAILITPPWWRKNWAYAGYIFLLSLTLYGLRTYDKKRQRLKHDLEMEQLHAQKLEEVDRMKSRFFTNISHEFRTPLTLIKGPVKQLFSGEFKGNLKEQYGMILRNSDRLLNLVNQLLDFSKLESGKMKLQVVHADVVEFLKGIVLSFCSLAERKKITLNFEVKEESLMGYIDQDKVEKIVINLLSNAFKFTPDGGKIVVHVGRGEAFSNNDHSDTNSNVWNDSPLHSSPQQSQPPIPNSQFQILISNTGPDIPPDEIDKIFDRFYQADSTYNKDSEGTGIGLALTKELVELHNGTIEVQCDDGAENRASTGRDLSLTTFTIMLPIGKEHFDKDDIVEEDTGCQMPDTEEKAESPPPSSASGLQSDSSDIRSADSGLPSPLVLVVEDNPDVTTYIRSFMDHEYGILSAKNGEDGWKKALDKHPDLIISDVMMPVMDGFELCKKLKSDPRTCHVPVILLTAKADMDSKIEGLEFGADDYISKPFEARELQVRVKNLIDQRQTLRAKFGQMLEINPGEVTASSLDEKFLIHLLKVFEEHISESDFSTEEFAREVGMSRMNLNRKLQALTNHSTHDFILTLRLKRAAQLLKRTTSSVSEIAYSIGFNSPSHFAYAFRKRFGQPPSTYAKSERLMRSQESSDQQ